MMVQTTVTVKNGRMNQPLSVLDSRRYHDTPERRGLSDKKAGRVSPYTEMVGLYTYTSYLVAQ